MSSNGQAHDEGLKAIELAFEDAKYLDADGKECANLMILGAHREIEIADNVIMEIFGSITEGKNVKMTFATDSGNGYEVHIENYGDMVKLMQGTLDAYVIAQTVET